MQEIPINNLVLASNLIHYFQGVAVLTAAVVEAYSHDNPAGKMKLAIPVSFIFFGFLSVIAIIHFLGNWNFQLLSEILKIKRVFLILNAISFLFISAGLCSLMAFMYSDVHKIWRTLFLLFLLGAGVLYLSVHTKVSHAAAGNVFVHHLPVFITLALAVLCKIIAFKINKKVINIAGFIFLMMTAFGLLSYREAKMSFEPGSIVLQSVVGTESPKPDDTRAPLPKTIPVGNHTMVSPTRRVSLPANDKTPGKRALNRSGTGQAKQKKQK